MKQLLSNFRFYRQSLGGIWFKAAIYHEGRKSVMWVHNMSLAGSSAMVLDYEYYLPRVK